MGNNSTDATLRRGIAVDAEGFSASERLASYEIANTLLTMKLRIQKAFGLRPEELQVFLVIVLATVQRYVRNPEVAPQFKSAIPLSQELSGFVSRRGIAEAMGIPLETVRRHVKRLIERGLVVERTRGCLSTRGGTLARLNATDTPMALAGDIAALCGSLLRMGAFRAGRPAR